MALKIGHRWLTVEEFRAWPPEKRQRVRLERKQEYHGTESGNAPWVDDLGKNLGFIALQAVKLAAKALLMSGAEKAGIAIDHLMENRGDNDITRDAAGKLVQEAFDAIGDGLDNI